jgi:hypothetical protein
VTPGLAGPGAATAVMSSTDHLATPFANACWRDVRRRRDLLPALGPEVLLHAGPPFESEAPAAVRQAAVQAILFEGLAADASAAHGLLARGAVRLMAAQDFGIVTPLAQVVSASMPLAIVGDGEREGWGALVEGTAPALRFGSADPAARTRLAGLVALGIDRLAGGLRAQPVPIDAIVRRAVAAGDECHGRTVAANDALVASLDWLGNADRAALLGNPGFVLPVLMAAACWRLGGPDSPIAAVGGNGLHFGLRLRAETSWRTVIAEPPVGTRAAGHAATLALGAIGDSAVVDFCGLGGQALAAAPVLREEWRAVLPDDLAGERDAVIDPVTGLVDPARVHASGVAPRVNLAILDAEGRQGLVGRGVHSVATALFAPART